MGAGGLTYIVQTSRLEVLLVFPVNQIIQPPFLCLNFLLYYFFLNLISLDKLVSPRRRHPRFKLSWIHRGWTLAAVGKMGETAKGPPHWVLFQQVPPEAVGQCARIVDVGDAALNLLQEGAAVDLPEPTKVPWKDSLAKSVSQ